MIHCIVNLSKSLIYIIQLITLTTYHQGIKALTRSSKVVEAKQKPFVLAMPSPVRILRSKMKQWVTNLYALLVFKRTFATTVAGDA